MGERLLSLACDAFELASLSIFVIMIGLAARALGA